MICPVQPDEILAGKYRVEGVLGLGGMGVVVAARHLQLDERVAIKFLLPEALSNPEAVARFDREARAAVKIKSEYVAHVIDVGCLESGAPFMVMEFLEGRDLASWLEQRGPLPIAQAAEFVLQACEAVAEAHALGIVHRDLKPANLFCVKRADGVLAVKVLDFGISKVTAAAGELAMTRTDTIIGSPLYMSPEQIQASHNVDGRADIWSLGVILYELCSGRMPFDAEGVTDLALQIVTAPPTPLRAVRPDLPEAFERVVLRCLEKSLDRRFLNVGELAVALAPFAPPRARSSVDRITRMIQSTGNTSPSLLLPVSVATSPLGHTRTSASWVRTGQDAHTRSSGRAVTAGISAALLVVAAAAIAEVRYGHPLASQVEAVAAMQPVSAPAPTSPVLPAPRSTAPTPSSEASEKLAPIDPTDAPLPSASHAAPHRAPEHRTPPAPLHAAAVQPVPSAPHTVTDCDPPYVIDSAGHRQYRPECL